MILEVKPFRLNHVINKGKKKFGNKGKED